MNGARFRHRAGRIAEREETRPSPRLRLVRVRRAAFVVAGAGMGDVMREALRGSAGPAVVYVEDQRGLCGRGRVRRLPPGPGPETDSANILALVFGWVSGTAAPLQASM